MVNLRTGKRMVCQFNPTRLQERLGAVQYARLEPLGQSFQVLHYRNTENGKVTLDFYMDAIGTGFDIGAFRAFLVELMRPVANQGPSGPPAVLVIWPQALTAVACLVDVSFTTEQFAANGTPLVCTAQCTFEIDAHASAAHGGG